MLRVGLTGGLASGKSMVGEYLVSQGCHLAKADQLGHQAIARGGEAYAPVVAEFGRGILDDNGDIVRSRLAAEVFGRPERLERLNKLVHPAVFHLEEAWLAETARLHPDKIAIVEAALLIESGNHRNFDRVVVVVCAAHQQVERAVARDRMTAGQAQARMAGQWSAAAKCALADYVIDNSTTLESTLEQTRAVLGSLRRIAA